MILANGLIRTLDPQVPTQRALAVAGDRIAGGVGVHETALASPEVTDLGGRVVLPGFTDSHVHFPTWALAQSEVNLDGSASLEEALARVAGAPRTAAWLRGYGWRSGDWQPQREPTRQDRKPLPLALAQHIGARVRERRPRGRGRCRRARRLRRANRRAA